MPTIKFVTSNSAVDFPEDGDVNVLRVSIRNECGIPYRCASGNCGTDRVYVESGAENLSTPRKREREASRRAARPGWRLACQTCALGDCVHVGSRTEGPRQAGRRPLAAVGGRRAA